MSDTPFYDGMATTTVSKPAMGSLRDGVGSPIGNAVDQQNAELENLIDEVHRLLDKIQPITGPDMNPQPGDPSDKPSAPNSDIANHINRVSRRMVELRRLVVNVRERVEL